MITRRQKLNEIQAREGMPVLGKTSKRKEIAKKMKPTWKPSPELKKVMKKDKACTKGCAYHDSNGNHTNYPS